MNKGIVYAILAALLNASVGTFTTGAFSTNITAEGIAFYKCLIALCILSVVVLLIPEQRKQWVQLFAHIHKVALMALMGIFILYYFETASYQYTSIGITVFTLQGFSTITTFIGSQIILGIKHSSMEWVSMVLAMIGLVILFLASNTISGFNEGILLAALSGMGYGLFLVLNKKIALPFHGPALLWWLLLFGSIYLFIPFSFHAPTLPTFESWIYIGCLASLGTIGGFYFTIKALQLLHASRVQLYELCEPIFAALLGIVVFSQWLTVADIIGALLIFISIYILNCGTQILGFFKSTEKLNEV